MAFLFGGTPFFDSDDEVSDVDDYDFDEDEMADMFLDDLNEEDKTCIDASPGFRVIRGPDWAYKNQDGGEGHVGTVIGVSSDEIQKVKPEWHYGNALVQWDNGNKGLYRTGHKRAYDLRVVDTTHASNIHWRVWCDGCDKDDIGGIRWRCTQCFAIDLCTECYMGDKHDLNHAFMRVNSSEHSSLGPEMMPRRSSSHVPIFGIFPGARVVDYPGWYQRKYGCQSGRVTSLRPWKSIDDHGDDKKQNGGVQVDFGHGGVTSRRCGEQDGSVDIACTIPGAGGDYYTGHLPQLGYDDRIEVGDFVVVGASTKELEEFQRRRGLWKPDMHDLSRQECVVEAKLDCGNLSVTLLENRKFDQTFTINPAAVVKRHSFCPGQKVQVSFDGEMVQRLQCGHGGWSTEMKKIIGHFGRIKDVVDEADVRVEIEEKLYIMNAACLTPTLPWPEDRPKRAKTLRDEGRAFMNLLTDPVVYATTSNDTAKLERMITEKPSLVHHEPYPGNPLVAVVAGKCNLKMLKVLIENGAYVETVDAEGCTPLMRAVVGNKHDNVKYLLEKGACVNSVGAVGTTSFYLACSKGHTRCADILLQHGADVNMKSLTQIPPLLQAVDNSKSAPIFAMMLRRVDTDLKAVNEDDFQTAVHLAVSAKRERALERLIEKAPRLASRKTLTGMTPLMITANTDAFVTAEILLKKGQCDMDAKERVDGMTALMIAVAKVNVNVLQLLVKYGADLNIRNKAGNPALQIAINICGPGIAVVPDHPIFTEMKNRWRRQRIRSNEDALLAYLVWNGADLETLNCKNFTVLRSLRMSKDPIAPALLTIQRQRRQMTNKKAKAAPNMPKERKDFPRGRSKKHSNAFFRRGDSKGPRCAGACEHHGAARPKDMSLHKDKDTEQSGPKEECPGKAQEIFELSLPQTESDVSHLKAQLRKRDEEIESMRQQLQRLEFEASQRILVCGHDVYHVDEDSIPECTGCCCEPIHVVDVE